ncbi:1-acyl-sn-glycerol-3-phosphate acyltransferase [Lachnospiraceae bacterium XBB1006]|nr:1-acyl-sn-glycerol-3-phosphate acyltransferase [Lachnospiraceae bacterium XBB1006]
MIRAFFAVLFVALFLILSSPLMAIEYFVHKKNPKKADMQSLRIVQWAFRCVMFFSGMTYEVTGLEYIPDDEPVVFVANHASMFDVVVVYSLLPYTTGFVSKKSVLKVPLLRVWMKRLHCLFLDRENPRDGLNMILNAIELLKQGISVFIFPEGTRSKNGELLEFKAGAVKMATKTGCKVIPIAIKGTRDALENHFPFVRSAHAKVAILPPVNTKALEPEEKKHLADYVRGQIAVVLED